MELILQGQKGKPSEHLRPERSAGQEPADEAFCPSVLLQTAVLEQVVEYGANHKPTDPRWLGSQVGLSVAEAGNEEICGERQGSVWWILGHKSMQVGNPPPPGPPSAV